MRVKDLMIDNWQRVALRAWSMWAMFFAVVFSGLEVFLQLMEPSWLGVRPGVFAALSAVVSALAMPLRLIAQRAFARDESGAARGRTVIGAAVIAAVVGMALPVIQQWEGRSLVAYEDIVGVATICDGETRGVQMGDRATAAECDAMTAKAVREFELAIRPCLPADLPVKTRAAFVVTAYNIGSAGFCKSSMSRRAMAGDLRGACDALLSWNKGRFPKPLSKEICTKLSSGGYLCTVRGLTNRRTAERKLCLEGLQ